MKCLICKTEKKVFFCVTVTGHHVVACSSCAYVCNLKIIEEVLEKEVSNGNKGVEEEGSRKG